MTKRNKNTTPSGFVNEYGAYVVGFLGALGALLFAVLMPSDREMLIGAAGLLALFTFFWTRKNSSWGLRLIGMIAAGITVSFGFLMPEYSAQLLQAGGLIAGASLLFA